MTRRLQLVLGFITLAGFVALSTVVRDGFRRVVAAHWELGRGGTPIVLVHGLGSNVDHWLPVARQIGRRHRVVLVELPGHGVSAMPIPFTLDRATAALDSAIAEATSGPVVVVGHSIGGLVAANLALNDPARVRSLVLVETVLRPTFNASERRELRAALDSDWEGTVRSVWTSFGRDSLQGQSLYAAAAEVDRATMRAWIELALDADLSSHAVGIAVPVTAVFAARNWERGLPWSEVSGSLGYDGMRRLTPVRLEDCGHFVMLDRPADLARLVEEHAHPTAARRPAPIAARGD